MAGREIGPLEKIDAEIEGLTADDLSEKDNDGRPLDPWMITFAEWLAAQDERPSLDDQLEKANELRQRITKARYIQMVKKRPRFRAYYKKMRMRVLERARAMVEERIPQGILAHFQGLDMALDAQDHRAIYHYTTPILDRAMPKRQEGMNVTAVTINLTPKMLQSIDEDIPTVECEVVDDDDDT